MVYQISTAFAIYFVLWWLTLFLTLPFGVRSQHEDGVGAPGTDPGAPIATPNGPQVDLDNGHIGGDFRHLLVGLWRRLSLGRTVVEADGNAVLGHDPEKCAAVFRKDHAPNKNLKRDLVAL